MVAGPRALRVRRVLLLMWIVGALCAGISALVHAPVVGACAGGMIGALAGRSDFFSEAH